MVLPKFVIEWCKQYDNCKGCKIGCVAPLGEERYGKWLESTIDKIREASNVRA